MPVHSEQQARQRIRQLVQNVKSQVGWDDHTGYRGSDDPVASLLGITVKEVPLPLGEDGCYIPADPPIVIINSTVSCRERRNFTYYHEILHHLVREDGELYGFIHEYASHTDIAFQAALEHYCNVGAAEFLVPMNQLSDIVREEGFTMQLVERLETRFPASKPAIAMQLAHCASHRCFVVVCEWGTMPQEDSAQGSYLPPRLARSQLYVLYGVGSPSVRYPIGRFVPVPKDHPIFDAYKTRMTIRREAPILFKNGNRSWRCECEAVYYKERVYAAFNASDPIPVQQLTFPLH